MAARHRPHPWTSQSLPHSGILDRASPPKGGILNAAKIYQRLHRSRGSEKGRKGLPRARRWRPGGLVLALHTSSTSRSAPDAGGARDGQDRGRLCLWIFWLNLPGGAPRWRSSPRRSR